MLVGCIRGGWIVGLNNSPTLGLFFCSEPHGLKYSLPIYKESFGYKLSPKERTLLSRSSFSPFVRCNFIGESDTAFKTGQLQRGEVLTLRHKAGLDGKVTIFVLSRSKFFSAKFYVTISAPANVLLPLRKVA